MFNQAVAINQDDFVIQSSPANDRIKDQGTMK